MPVSSIHGSGKFIDGHFEHDEEGDTDHILIAPGEYQLHESHSIGHSGKFVPSREKNRPGKWRVNSKTTTYGPNKGKITNLLPGGYNEEDIID